MIQPNPEDLRQLAREATYPNRAAEDEALRAIDEAVFDRVRVHERHLQENARALMTDKHIHETAAQDVVEALKTELRYPLMDGGKPTPERAERYEALRGHAEKAMKELKRAEEEAAWLEAKVADPHGDLVKLWTKYPLVRPLL